MNFLDFLQPNSEYARFTIYSIYLIAGLWLIVFLIWAYRVRSVYEEIQKAEDIDFLKAKTNEHIKGSLIDINGTFDDYCEVNGISEDGIVSKHLSTIFHSGCNGSRLDVGELIRNSTGDLLRSLGLLKSIQALFIIVGLLGTLFGLADSLDQLSQLNLQDLVGNDPSSTVGIQHFLSPLKSAFAPSIVGILTTIICVILLSSFSARFVNRTANLLERTTIDNWVPNLFPSTTHRFLQGVKLAQEYIEPLVQYSREIQDGTKLFLENLSEASAPLKAINASVNKVNKFADAFQQATQNLSSFEAELRTLYEQMVEESGKFHSNVENELKTLADNHEAFVSDSKLHSAHIKAIYGAIRIFEDGYLDERKAIENGLHELLRDLKKANTAIFEKSATDTIAFQSMLVEIQKVAEAATLTQKEVVTKLESIQISPDEYANKLSAVVAGLETAIERIPNHSPTVIDIPTVPIGSPDSKEIRNLIAAIETNNTNQAQILGKVDNLINSLEQYLVSEKKKVNDLQSNYGSRSFTTDPMITKSKTLNTIPPSAIADHSRAYDASEKEPINNAYVSPVSATKKSTVWERIKGFFK